MPPVTQTLPGLPVHQCSSDELTKLVRKLRWMGLEQEAEQMQRTLNKFVPAGGVLTAPHETD